MFLRDSKVAVRWSPVSNESSIFMWWWLLAYVEQMMKGEFLAGCSSGFRFLCEAIESQRCVQYPWLL